MTRRTGRPPGPPPAPPEIAARIVVERNTHKRTWQAIADGLTADKIPTMQGAAAWRKTTVRAIYLRATRPPTPR